MVVLVSGRGSHLQNLINLSDELNFKIAHVITNQSECNAMLIASKNGLSGYFAAPGGSRDKNIGDAIERQDPDLVILAGYMQILPPKMINRFPNKILNIHPSLLPAFPGLHAQKQAFKYGVKVSGCTVHIVDEGVDTGKILAQSAVIRKDDDTLEDFSARILAAEHELYPRVIKEYGESLRSNND